MLKRANKITSMLVAATTLVTTAPVATIASASERLGTKDGQFTQAFAYAEGKYVFDGYRTDDDDDALYFNDGDDDKEVDDSDDYDYDDAERYGDKYVTVKDGDDTYLLDLSTGEIDDGESIEDKADNVRSKLKTNLKKADRYSAFKESGSDIDATGEGSNTNVCDQILTNKYGEVWYKYKVKGDGDVDKFMASGDQYIGVVNEKNKYLDLSYVANLNIYSPTKGKTVKIDNYDDDESGISAKLVDVDIIAQDEDYLYAVTTVEVTDENIPAAADSNAGAGADSNAGAGADSNAGAGADSNAGAGADSNTGAGADSNAGADADSNAGADADSNAGADTDSNAGADADAPATPASTNRNTFTRVSTQYFFQKISKAQGSKEDDAYTPKSVASYQLDNGTVFDSDDDRDDAYDVLMKAAEGDDSIINVQVVDSVINVAEKNDDNIKVYQLKFKKDKIDGKKFVDGEWENKSNIDSYVVFKDNDDDEDVIDTDDAKPYSVDVNGNLWILGKGKIYKFEKDEFKELYTCDRSINCLDVYDDENLIAWLYDDDIYTALQGGKKAKDDDDNNNDDDNNDDDKNKNEAVVGWNKNEDGTWSFYDATGAQVKASWVNVGGVWYYLKDTGVMATGWLQEGGNWYYLNASGAMQTGWFNDNGTWYYLKSSGAMATGWLQDTDGNWYYLNASGAMVTNTTVDGYYLGANGAWVK